MSMISILRYIVTSSHRFCLLNSESLNFGFARCTLQPAVMLTDVFFARVSHFRLEKKRGRESLLVLLPRRLRCVVLCSFVRHSASRSFLPPSSSSFLHHHSFVRFIHLDPRTAKYSRRRNRIFAESSSTQIAVGIEAKR
jgi:hypothetical protein